MKYDFTTLPDRAGKDALALDVIPTLPVKIRDGFRPIPMWVADMNFATCPTIQTAITERVAHPLFGYYITRPEYYDLIIKWQSTRNGVTGLTKDMIGYENSVLGGAASALTALTAPGEAILVHSPTYVGFTHVFEDLGRKVIHSPLHRDEEGVWRMDLDDMREKIRANHIHVAVFCSPHNPCGRVWSREEIEAMMQLMKEEDCYVISDEIWSDLILDGNHHIPTQSVSEDAKNRTIALYAPSKTFNLAGLIGSYHIIYNKMLRDRVDKVSGNTFYNHMNLLSMYALIGAYQPEGYEWVDELCQVLTDNAKFAVNFIRENFPGVSVAMPQGTYIIFLDCEEYCKKTGRTVEELYHAGLEVGVIWQDGRPFFGEHSIRVNLALPTEVVKEAFGRLKEYVFK